MLNSIYNFFSQNSSQEEDNNEKDDADWNENENNLNDKLVLN
jgi:hypothetical protein|tara:strand:+ start:428 stop:553 length:126 start_codon:yes stop_codon:yes gene_type:complete